MRTNVKNFIYSGIFTRSRRETTDITVDHTPKSKWNHRTSNDFEVVQAAASSMEASSSRSLCDHCSPNEMRIASSISPIRDGETVPYLFTIRSSMSTVRI